MYPSPVGGLIGRAGGMPLLVLVTALAAGAALAAVTGRRRLLLLALAGPWFLFPGVDALGLLPLLLLGRSRSSSAIAFALAGVTHGIAALCIIPALITPYGRAIAALLVGAFVAVLFTVQGELAGVTGGVGPIEHLAWTTRYLLPGLFLLALDRERHDREGATRRV
jgi:hypothetical protein